MDWKKEEKNIVMHGEKMNVVESIDRHKSDKLALVFEDGKRREISYQQLHKDTNKFANLLKSFGMKKDSKIFFFLPKVPELYIGILGALKAGCIAVPLFEAFQEEGLGLRLERGDAEIIVTNKELGERVDKIKDKIKTLKEILIIDSDDFKKKFEEQESEFEIVLKNKMETGMMIFTSSTAGTPVAGIQIPHYGLVQQDYTARLVLDLKENDNYWCTAHPGWVTGSIYGILAPLSVGCTIYILEGRFDANSWIDFLKRNKISVVYTAPTALRMLKPEINKEDLSGVRVIGSVGEALTKATYDFYKKLGVDINDTYWQTETGAIVIAGYDNEKKEGAIGKSVGVEAEIKDGAIALKKGWPAMMTGIYKHEKMYDDYFSGEWFKTNDLARKDKEFFFFEGRKDDIIKTSGERVSPIEIESILMKHPAVREAGVIGVPDKIKGSIIKAFVVLNSGCGLRFTSMDNLSQVSSINPTHKKFFSCKSNNDKEQEQNFFPPKFVKPVKLNSYIDIKDSDKCEKLKVKTGNFSNQFQEKLKVKTGNFSNQFQEKLKVKTGNFSNQFQEKLKEELSAFVKQHYAGHAYPKIIEFVKELPKTNSGKIIRMKLREMK